MLPSNLNLRIGKTAGYNNKILIRNKDMKSGSNRNASKAKAKFRSPMSTSEAFAITKMPEMKSSNKPIKVLVKQCK